MTTRVRGFPPLREIVMHAQLPLRPGGPRIPMDVLECGHAEPVVDNHRPDRPHTRRRCVGCQAGRQVEARLAEYAR